MFSLIGALKVAAGALTNGVNGFAEFVIVPKVATKGLLKEFGMDPSSLECHFCHDPLRDLRQLRAIYNYDGKYVAACDKFECAIEARDRLIE